MMKLDINELKVTVVVTPVDLRSGYCGLSVLVHATLGINVDKGKDLVVFVSRNRNLAKLIWSDKYGRSLLTRRLHRGRFEAFLARAEGPATQELNAQELSKFLDGWPIMVKRKGILNG